MYQNELIDNSSLKQSKNFWKQYLAGYTGFVELPYESARNLHAARYRFVINKETTLKLKEFIYQKKSTLNTACLAFFNLFLYKITYQKDLVIGCPFTLRQSNEWQDIMGYFINSLPVRMKFHDTMSFSELVSIMGKDLLEIEKNKNLPFEEILKVAELEKSKSVNPLIQVWFVLENQNEYSELKLSNLLSKHHSIPQKHAKFDLMLIVEVQQEELSLIFEYDQGIFSETTMENWSKNFIDLLENVLSNPAKDIKYYYLENHEMSILL